MRRADLTRALGLGHRPELASELLLAPGSVDFVEVVAEACLAEGRVRREVRALAELWPVVPHGVKLSLGSAEGIERARAERLGALARELDAPVVSEHVALTRAGGRDIGHLTPVPRTRLAVRVVARNVDQARRALPDVPFLLENVASPFTWPEDELDEPTFYAAIAEATGCELLLDVGNLYANAVNEGLDPLAVVRAFPLERVRMMHLAGGVFEHGFYYDTHAHPVPDAVLDVLGEALSRAPDAAILLERDAGFEVGLGALLDELSRASQRRPPREAGRRRVSWLEPPPPTPARRERERLERARARRPGRPRGRARAAAHLTRAPARRARRGHRPPRARPGARHFAAKAGRRRPAPLAEAREARRRGARHRRRVGDREPSRAEPAGGARRDPHRRASPRGAFARRRRAPRRPHAARTLSRARGARRARAATRDALLRA
jgi:uncharacterized protein (UPF0276 family)